MPIANLHVHDLHELDLGGQLLHLLLQVVVLGNRIDRLRGAAAADALDVRRDAQLLIQFVWVATQHERHFRPKDQRNGDAGGELRAYEAEQILDIRSGIGQDADAVWGNDCGEHVKDDRCKKCVYRNAMHLLKRNHRNVHQRNVVDRIRNHARLIVQRLRVPHIITHANAPRQEQHLANRQTVIPPIVRAQHKLQPMIVPYHLRERRARQRPRAQIDQHHQQYGHHPLQQLLVGQLHLVRRLDAIRQRDAPRLHQQRRVRQTEAHVARPLGRNARAHVQYRKDGGHLQVHDGAADKRDGEKRRTRHLEHFHLARSVHVQAQRQREADAQHGDRQQRQAKRPIVRGQAGARVRACVAAGRAAQALKRGGIVGAHVVAPLLKGDLHQGARKAGRMTQRIEAASAAALIGAARPVRQTGGGGGSCGRLGRNRRNRGLG